MKATLKRVVALTLSLVMVLALALTAQAAEGDLSYAIYHVTAKDGYTLTPKTSSNQADVKVTENGVDYYKKTVKFDFSFSGTDAQHVVFLLSDGVKVPSATTIRFIDQNTGKWTYNIYPDTMEKAGTYTVCVSSADGYVEAATFEVKMLYKPGDVDLDGEITVSDASLVLQHVAQLTTLEGEAILAANVDTDGEITVSDASLILQKVAQLIDVFPVEQ